MAPPNKKKSSSCSTQQRHRKRPSRSTESSSSSSIENFLSMEKCSQKKRNDKTITRPVLIDLSCDEENIPVDDDDDDDRGFQRVSLCSTPITALPRSIDSNTFLLNPAFRDLFTPSSLVTPSSSSASSPSPRVPCGLAAQVGAVGPVEHIWQLLCAKERIYNTKRRDMLTGHPLLTVAMRTVLIDWLMEVCDTERLHRETFHLAVDYMDRFLSATHHIEPVTLQLVGITALFLAAKNEEIYPPKIDQLASYTDGACTEEQMRSLEVHMLKELTWALTPITAIHWLSIYMQLLGGYSLSEHSRIGASSSVDCTRSRIMRDEFISLAQTMDTCLLDIESLSFSNSIIAATLVYCTYEPERLITQITGYSTADLCKCGEWMEPIVMVCEEQRIVGDPLPQFDDIAPDQVHNIQIHLTDSDKTMTKIRELRQSMAHRRIAIMPRQKRPFR